MWFTRVSLKNPVFATMMMLAIVVLGLFSLQRLKVDQFPNIDFPVVVVLTEYPGASPEIVESEVTKKIEEGVNSIAGISALTSRTYEGQSVVVMEFDLNTNSRKAAEDVREKVASVKPLLRTEVKEPRVLRFDPSSRAVWSVAVIPQAATNGQAPSLVELTNWSEQVLKKKLENVNGVGSVTVVGGSRRELNLYLRPEAMEALGVSADQVVNAVRNENQDAPVGTLKSAAQERVVQVQSRMVRPEDFGNIIVARKGNTSVRLSQVATVKDGAQELENMAMFNGERTLLLTVQKSQDENTIEVVDGLVRAIKDMQTQLPPGIRLEQVTDNSRSIRVGVENVRRTLIEGALLTVLIVFLFLNSWRSTVITGLTLPISIIGTFLFMDLFGFTINMITLMALSLCVGLLIDDAIVVRENIVREFPEVRYTVVTINTGNALGKNNVNMGIRFKDRKDRQLSVDQISAKLRERLLQVSGITVTHIGTTDSVGGNKQIEFSILGADQHELERLTLMALEKLRTVPGLVDLDSSVKANKPTIGIEVLRDAAADVGLGVQQLAGPLRTLVAGQIVGNWRAPDDQTYDVNVRLDPSARNTPQDLERLPFSVVNPADGSQRQVRLGQVAKVTETTGSNQINRRDLMREVSINANAYGRTAGEVSAEIKKIMEALPLPAGYRFQFGGSTKSMNESFAYALSALVMAIIFIYMILASQFKSFFQPVALMTSLPLTLIGVVLALMAFRSSLSMFSVIGVVMLMGLVTKNAILLVDFAIRAREEGMERNQALLMAAKVRLRPILMTTLAMVFGMIPLAFALTEGSEQRAPMGQAVIGGVITSSLLTLVVVPVMYGYMDDLAQWLRQKAGFAPARQSSQGPDL